MFEIFRKGKTLWGACGNVKLLNLVNAFPMPRKPNKMSFEDYIINVVADGLFSFFKKNDYINCEKMEFREDGQILILTRDGMYLMSSDCGTLSVAEEFIAIGSADELTIGVLDQSPKNLKSDKEIKGVILKTLKLVAQRDAAVGPPFVVEKL